MTIIQAIILSIIEGVTEFLPISSTGHMILVSTIFGIANDQFTKSFEIIIQLGAILAVVFLYWKKIITNIYLIKKILVAFLPTALIGFLLYTFLKNYLLGNATLVMVSFFIGGVLMILFELWYSRRPQNFKELNYQKSFLTGLAQSLAIIPGLSRSGTTIISGLFMGLSRETIVEFSFLLAIPTMATATGYDLLKNAGEFHFDQWYLLLLGFVVSFMVAILSIKWFLGYIKNHSFIGFGIYRIVVAIIFFIILD